MAIINENAQKWALMRINMSNYYLLVNEISAICKNILQHFGALIKIRSIENRLKSKVS